MPPTTRLQKRSLARRLFLENGGDIPLAALARETGLSRQSLTKIKAAENWDLELKLAKAAARPLALEVVGDSIEKVFDRHVKILNRIADHLEARLAEEKLSPTDVLSLTRATGEVVKNLRLITGESTENHAHKVKGEMRHSHEAVEPAFDEVCRKIADTGHAEGQRLLMQHIELRQKITELRQELD